MNIKTMEIHHNRSYQHLVPQGIVLHETANPGDSAANEYKYFDSSEHQACAHAFIDTNEVIICVPFDEKAWHAGHTANEKYLGFELCHANNAIDFFKIWDNAVEFFANTFITKLNITTISNDNLPSHAEISQKYKETDHMDPVSYFAQYGKSVNDFRIAVQSRINVLLRPPLRVTYKGREISCNPFIKDGATYVQIRPLLEQIGKKVAWDGNTKTVIISD